MEGLANPSAGFAKGKRSTHDFGLSIAREVIPEDDETPPIPSPSGSASGLHPGMVPDIGDTSTSKNSNLSIRSTKRGRQKSATYSVKLSDVDGTWQSGTRRSIDETDSKQVKQQRSITDLRAAPKGYGSATWTNSAYAQLQAEKHGDKHGWDELMNLDTMHRYGIISTEEFKARKEKLTELMTGTHIKRPLRKFEREHSNKIRILAEKEIHKEVPEWEEVKAERAICYSCRIDEESNERWSSTLRMVKVAPHPFNHGSLRFVYYMLDITDNPQPLKQIAASQTLTKPLPATHVAKIAIDPFSETNVYFIDVAMQTQAQQLADLFNRHNVPKKVAFLECWVYELIDRNPHVYCGVERYIEGEYKKYMNNMGWINDAVGRNTPQAFSHFTYESTGHKMLVCDLQGVGDIYTDPQIHTPDGTGGAEGNGGQRGIDKFLETHQCNAICRFLKLPIVNKSVVFENTRPAERFMKDKKITVVDTIRTNYTGVPTETLDAPLLSGGSSGSHVALIPRRIDDSSDRQLCCCVLM